MHHKPDPSFAFIVKEVRGTSDAFKNMLMMVNSSSDIKKMDIALKKLKCLFLSIF
jgi:hypothetical protein